MSSRSTTATTRLRHRAEQIDEALAQAFPDARCELDYATDWQLLVATVLSAQTTDVRVNSITPELFGRWPSVARLAQADPRDVAEVIRPLGFASRRSVQITTLARQLEERFEGRVPRTREELMSLSGVGRKTSHVVLAEAFGVPELAVDTHVMRTSSRLGLTSHHDPLAVEEDLVPLFDRRELAQVSHRLIFLGRRVCHARRPACPRCPVADLCPSASS